MKKLFILSGAVVFLLMFSITSCNSQTNSDNSERSDVEAFQDESAVVTVYYFHGDRRCTTCKAVGSVSKETIAENFSDNTRVIFKDVNIEDVENNEIKDKLEMSGSGLFIYDGKTKKDLTAIAFQKAVSSPEDLSAKIIETVNELL